MLSFPLHSCWILLLILSNELMKLAGCEEYCLLDDSHKVYAGSTCLCLVLSDKNTGSVSYVSCSEIVWVQKHYETGHTSHIWGASWLLLASSGLWHTLNNGISFLRLLINAKNTKHLFLPTRHEKTEAVFDFLCFVEIGIQSSDLGWFSQMKSHINALLSSQEAVLINEMLQVFWENWMSRKF